MNPKTTNQPFDITKEHLELVEIHKHDELVDGCIFLLCQAFETETRETA